MGFKSFLGLVEIRTKLASIIPFLLGTIFALYHYNKFNALNFIFLFGSLISIDMATTALNNYFDYRRANKKQGYNYETHNSIVKDELSQSTVLTVIAALLAIAVTLGILLFINTNIIVLTIGVLSFIVAICYSFGPLPISRTPLGEMLSGLFMGFVIVLLSVYIHIYDMDIISLKFENLNLYLHLNLVEIIYIFMLSIPTICGIANIMLANNLSDVGDDIENSRFTLPYYIGKKNALRLFKSLYYVAYVDIIILCLLKIIPVICLITLFTIIPVYKNISLFYSEQTKNRTFSLSVKNFFLITTPMIFVFYLTWAIGYFTIRFP